MPLFLSLLPLYLIGNLHCLGMCGPLVMLIGRHRMRYWYFLGRTLSFAIAGWIAGEMGAVLHLFLQKFHLAAGASFLFGLLSFGIAAGALFHWHFSPPAWLTQWLGPLNRNLSLLMLRDQPWPAFLFGFFTVFLPCGQTVVVFTACALYGDGAVGFLNGLAFALLTSPSLFVAMQAQSLFQQARKYYNQALGFAALFVGTLAFCRGCAELGWIPHLILNAHYHIVLY